jgi:hypothetical protein
LRPQETKELLQFCQEIGRMLGSMKDYAATFCPNDNARVRETPNFFAEPAPLSTEH